MHIYKHELQNNPILIYIVCFHVGLHDPASLCKPWDRLWTWILCQHIGCFTTSFYIYIRHSQANPRWVYQTINKSPILISAINIYISGTVKPTLVGFIRLSTNFLYLYQQPIIIQANPDWVYQAINNNTCPYINHKRPFSISPRDHTVNYICLS